MSALAAIFDLDGVLVLSARLHERSWRRLAENHGYPPPPVPNIGSLGVKTEAVISEMLGWTSDPREVRRLTVEKEMIFREMIRESGIESVPGAVEFVRALHGRKIPLGVGSSAPRENIEVCLAALELREAFSVVVSGSEVARGKPAPDIFLTVAERLGAEPSRCVVFEDAPAGVAAARAAGMRVVGLLTAHPPSALVAADRYARDFTEISPDDIVAWAADETGPWRAQQDASLASAVVECVAADGKVRSARGED